jgi:4-aminobutyrate aminotransferase/(S)-3-amino-2-methylpropionate transaminase
MMDWPRGPFPEYLYPLEDHRRENEQEDIRCLEEIEDIIYNKSKSDSPVAAVIAEPIQSEGGITISHRYIYIYNNPFFQ